MGVVIVDITIQYDTYEEYESHQLQHVEWLTDTLGKAGLHTWYSKGSKNFRGGSKAYATTTSIQFERDIDATLFKLRFAT